jgi:hypothetical protein
VKGKEFGFYTIPKTEVFKPHYMDLSAADGSQDIPFQGFLEKAMDAKKAAERYAYFSRALRRALNSRAGTIKVYR